MALSGVSEEERRRWVNILAERVDTAERAMVGIRRLRQDAVWMYALMMAEGDATASREARRLVCRLDSGIEGMRRA